MPHNIVDTVTIDGLLFLVELFDMPDGTWKFVVSAPNATDYTAHHWEAGGFSSRKEAEKAAREAIATTGASLNGAPHDSGE